jgi:cytochrome c oxidase assembly protein subunit 11
MTPSSVRYRWTVLPLIAGLAAIAGVVAATPRLYRVFCEATGYGGTVRAVAAPAPAQTEASDKTLTVFFDSNVAGGLPWEFRPDQRKVTVKLGEPVEVSYFARNLSDKTIVARALFNVTPFQIGPYFFKIECFCFTNERLGPGESAHMPLVFYVDDQAAKDDGAKGVNELTLSYTFYPQTGLSAEGVAAARDLAKGSAEKAAELAGNPKATFANDAARQ